MKLRLLALAAGLALIAAAPGWAGNIKVDFGACNNRSCIGTLKDQRAAFTDASDIYVSERDGEINYGRHGQYMKHVGFERRYGDQWTADLGSDGAKWNTTNPWAGSSAPQGGDATAPCDPGSSSTAPEPSSVSLFAIALIGLGLVARRRYSALKAVFSGE